MLCSCKLGRQDKVVLLLAESSIGEGESGRGKAGKLVPNNFHALPAFHILTSQMENVIFDLSRLRGTQAV